MKRMMTITMLALCATPVVSFEGEIGGVVEAEADTDNSVRVAMLTYGTDDSTSVCFSDEFIETVRFETSIDAQRGFLAARLDDDSVFEHPFVVMTGEGAFELSAAESANLGAYLTSGGFVLASAGCSNAEWDESFRNELEIAMPEHALEAITLQHDLFGTVFDIATLDSKKSSEDIALEVLTVGGRVALVYSREGLNDTKNAGGDCCCCGASEIGNARYVNANVLAYALTY